MLRLVNIEQKGDIIEADYIPEKSNGKAHVSYNIIKETAVADVIDSFGKLYAQKAVQGLKRTIHEMKTGERKDLPKERLVMWY